MISTAQKIALQIYISDTIKHIPVNHENLIKKFNGKYTPEQINGALSVIVNRWGYCDESGNYHICKFFSKDLDEILVVMSWVMMPFFSCFSGLLLGLESIL